MKALGAVVVLATAARLKETLAVKTKRYGGWCSGSAVELLTSTVLKKLLWTGEFERTETGSQFDWRDKRNDGW